MEQVISIRERLCIVFGNTASLITITLCPDSPAKVRMECRRAQACGLLNPLERKLLALALDRAAEPGEIRNCAQKLIESWRGRGVVVEEFDHDGMLTLDCFGSRIIGFGQYKGERMGDLPADYLVWLIETPGIRKRYPDVVEAALAILERGMR